MRELDHSKVFPEWVEQFGELEAAAMWWDYSADIEYRNSVLQDTCRRTAKALRIQKETGIPVCSCCFKPLPFGYTTC